MPDAPTTSDYTTLLPFTDKKSVVRYYKPGDESFPIHVREDSKTEQLQFYYDGSQHQTGFKFVVYYKALRDKDGHVIRTHEPYTTALQSSDGLTSCFIPKPTEFEVNFVQVATAKWN